MRTREQKNKYAKGWYAKNKKREQEKRRKYNQKNRGVIREWEKSYYKTPAGYYRHLKKKANLREIAFNLSKDEFIEWIGKQKEKCCYCLTDFVYDTKAGTSPSVDRKDNSKGYFIDNICLACILCNRAKNNYFSYEEFKIIGRAVRRVIKKRKC